MNTISRSCCFRTLLTSRSSPFNASMASHVSRTTYTISRSHLEGCIRSRSNLLALVKRFKSRRTSKFMTTEHDMPVQFSWRRFIRPTLFTFGVSPSRISSLIMFDSMVRFHNFNLSPQCTGLFFAGGMIWEEENLKKRRFTLRSLFDEDSRIRPYLGGRVSDWASTF